MLISFNVDNPFTLASHQKFLLVPPAAYEISRDNNLIFFKDFFPDFKVER